MTGEATTLVSGKTYRITDRAKRLIDPAQSLTVLDDGVGVSASDIETIDLLHGKVTFASAYTINGAITITGNYLPLSEITDCRSWSVSASMDLPDATVMSSSADGARKRQPTMRDATCSFSLLDDATPQLESLLQAGTSFYLMFGPGEDLAATDVAHFRGRFKLSELSLDGETDSLVQHNYTAQLDAVESTGGYDVSYSVTL